MEPEVSIPSTFETYEINTVRDLFSVPAGKLKDCLHDLHTFVVMVRAAQAAPEIFDAATLEAVRFTWIDDGKHTANITIKAPDGSEALRMEVEA
jgi:hypothetical protein